MTEPDNPPPTVDPRGLNMWPRPDPPSQQFRFFLGLCYGAVVSAVFWFGEFGGWFGGARSGSVLMYSFILLKFGPVLGLLFFREWRVAASGILFSILIGAFLFFAACAVNFKV